MVKLQILNLSVKLYLTNPEQTELLCQYVFNLARYDENYDIRDRARFLKPFIFPADGKETILSKNARKIFLAAKPAPLLESKYHGREQYQLGSLSHYLNIRATGYHDLPTFPTEAPDSSVRDTVLEMDRDTITVSEQHEVLPRKEGGGSSRGDDTALAKSSGRSNNKKSKSAASDRSNDVTDITPKKAGRNKSKSFYSDSDKSSSEYSSENDDSRSDDDDESESEDENGSSEAEEEENR